MVRGKKVDKPTCNLYIIEGLKKMISRKSNPHFQRSLTIAIEAIESYPIPLLTLEDVKAMKGCGDKLASIIMEMINNKITSDDTLDNSSVGNFDGGGNGNGKPKELTNYEAPISVENFLTSISNHYDFLAYFETFVHNGYSDMSFVKNLESNHLNDMGVKLGHQATIIEAVRVYKLYLEYIEKHPTGIDNGNGNGNNNYNSDENIFQDIVSFDKAPPYIELDDLKKQCSKNVFEDACISVYNTKVISIYPTNDTILASSYSHNKESKFLYSIEFNFGEDGRIYKDSCECAWTNHSQWCKHKVEVFLILDSNTGTRGKRLYPSSAVTSSSLLTPARPSPNKVTSKKPPMNITTTTTTTTTSTTPTSKSNKSTNNTSPSSPSSPSSITTYKQKKEYIPDPGSGAWAILLTLYDFEHQDDSTKDYLTKDELCYEGNKYLTTGKFDSSKPGGAWGGMKTLIHHELVIKSGTSAHYSLKQKGFELAKRCKRQDNRTKGIIDNGVNGDKQESKKRKFTEYDEDQDADDEDEVDQDEPIKTTTSNNGGKIGSKKNELIEIENEIYDWSDSDEELSNLFYEGTLVPHPIPRDLLYNEKDIAIDDVVLIIDNREIKDSDRSELLDKIRLAKIKHETRTLPIGDFLFIAKCHYTHATTSNDGEVGESFELLYNVIIERKKLADLHFSKRDGRYKEQKYKLKTLKPYGVTNITYLIEGDIKHGGISVDDYDNSIVETQIDDKFIVQLTDGMPSTVEYLVNIFNLFKSKSFRMMTSLRFADFENILQVSTSLKLSDLFACQLLQIPGVTVQKAKAIVLNYQTSRALVEAYNKVTEEGLDQDKINAAQDSLLENICIGGNKKLKIGLELSKKISNLYNTEDNYDEVDKELNGK